MTNEERDLITRFIERVGGAGSSAGFTGSVPSSQALPPIDHEADSLLADLFQKYPEARYRITQLAFVQEQALNAAQQRIQALQAQVQQAHQTQSQPGQSQSQGGASPWGAGAQPAQPQQRGFLSSLFGGGGAQPAPPQYAPPPPQYAPQYAAPAAMMQPQGSGFLGGALRTAAGVAGGLVAGEALMNLFEGNHGGGGFGGPVSMPFGGVGEGAGAGAWEGASQPGFSPDPYDQGGAAKDAAGSDPFATGQPVADNSGWTQGPDQTDTGWQPAADTSGSDGGGGWQDAAPDAGGGFDSGSNADDGGWTDSSSDA